MEEHVIYKCYILSEAYRLLRSVQQWGNRQSADCAKNQFIALVKAEALVELLEVDECGSTGGHDAGQPTPRGVFDRWMWLAGRYGCRYGYYEPVEEDVKAFFHC
jgi:hypothetical protein